MISEPRTIARIVELFHIPISHDVDLLRDVYMQVSKSCGYDNFLRQAGGGRLESASGDGAGTSRVTFAKDRITVLEEHGRGSLEIFRRKLEEVIQVSSEKLGIPIFVARNVTVRAISSVANGGKAADFIGNSLIQLNQEEMAPFGRPGNVVGVRMLFPSPDPKKGSHQVRVESYLRDPRCIYVEDQATFKFPLQSRDLRRLKEEIFEADAFVHERIHEFLGQFPRS